MICLQQLHVGDVLRLGLDQIWKKMFRQINVISDHQNYQQILWRRNVEDVINIYKLQTVTYGTKSAPYLAIRVLHKLAEVEKKKYPIASRILLSDTYVDDIISGADDVDEAINLQKQLCKLLNEGEFILRKRTSNSEELINNIPVELREKKDLF